MRVAVLAVAALVGASAWWALAAGPDAPAPAPAPGAMPALAAPVDLARGEALYAEYCAACHGADLEGQPDWRSPGPDGRLPAPPHDATGHTWHHDDATLFAYTKLGGAEALAAQGIAGFDSGMPGFGETMTDAEIRDVLEWIKSTWPPRERAAQAARTQAAGAGR
jgi:mono/diheme cytochrome c family protein